MRYTVIILFLISFQIFPQENTALLTGSVTSSKTSLPIKDVNIKVEDTSIGATTDSTGFYSVKIKPGSYLLTFSCIGFQNHRHLVKISSSTNIIELDVTLTPKVYEINEVSVKGNKISKPISVQEIKEKDLVTMPNLYSDVIRGVKILPGVTPNNELTSAYNVRGGNFDENLIYLNGYEIYRPFLLQQGIEESQSVVNQNIVRDIRFYNGAFPVNFDDKMSSVLEINYKNDFDSTLNGNFNVDLLKTGLTLNKRFGGFL